MPTRIARPDKKLIAVAHNNSASKTSFKVRGASQAPLPKSSRHACAKRRNRAPRSSPYSWCCSTPCPGKEREVLHAVASAQQRAETEPQAQHAEERICRVSEHRRMADFFQAKKLRQSGAKRQLIRGGMRCFPRDHGAGSCAASAPDADGRICWTRRHAIQARTATADISTAHKPQVFQEIGLTRVKRVAPPTWRGEASFAVLMLIGTILPLCRSSAGSRLSSETAAGPAAALP